MAPQRRALAARANSVACKVPGVKWKSSFVILKMVREAKGRKKRAHFVLQCGGSYRGEGQLGLVIFNEFLVPKW
jgi:hypothetical protein